MGTRDFDHRFGNEGSYVGVDIYMNGSADDVDTGGNGAAHCRPDKPVVSSDSVERLKASLSEMMGDDEGPAFPEYIQIGHQYSRAPIVEATIDFRVDLADENFLSDAEMFDKLSRVYSKTDDGFEPATPLYTFSPKMTIDDGDSVVGKAPGRQLGYSFKKSDGSAVVRANVDRFAYSWLSNYRAWDAFLAEAEGSWAQYRDAMNPQQVSAVGVRFVNRIVVPKKLIEIKDYLRATVDVPPYLPQWTTGYFLQIGIPLLDYDAEAVITTALVDPDDGDEKSTNLILDIDVRSQFGVEVSSADFAAELLKKLGSLRVAKNFVFEACITDATRGLIE